MQRSSLKNATLAGSKGTRGTPTTKRKVVVCDSADFFILLRHELRVRRSFIEERERNQLLSERLRAYAGVWKISCRPEFADERAALLVFSSAWLHSRDFICLTSSAEKPSGGKMPQEIADLPQG
jgi:hypothetical protein